MCRNDKTHKIRYFERIGLNEINILLFMIPNHPKILLSCGYLALYSEYLAFSYLANHDGFMLLLANFSRLIYTQSDEHS